MNRKFLFVPIDIHNVAKLDGSSPIGSDFSRFRYDLCLRFFLASINHDVSFYLVMLKNIVWWAKFISIID